MEEKYKDLLAYAYEDLTQGQIDELMKDLVQLEEDEDSDIPVQKRLGALLRKKYYKFYRKQKEVMADMEEAKRWVDLTDEDE